MPRLLVSLAVILIALLGLYVATKPSGPANDAAQKGDVGVLIGGDFALVNHKGEAVTAADYQGKLLLIYFGFTYCPDVCPTTLGDMASVLDTIRQGIDGLIDSTERELRHGQSGG